MTTEQDVKDFWDEVKRLEIANQTPDPVYEYRLYYDANGDITSGIPVIINRPLPELPEGNYIVVTHEEYKSSANKHVVDGKLCKKSIIVDVKLQLAKSDSGYKVVKNNAALLLDTSEEYQDTEFYDRTTS